MVVNKLPVAVLVCLLLLPVVGGTLSSFLPALGFFPSLGHNEFTLQYIAETWRHPDFKYMVVLTLTSGLISTLLAVILVIGIVSAWSNSKYLLSIEKSFRPMLLVPHATAAIALGFIFAPSGLIIRMLSPELTGFSLPPSWAFPNDNLGIAMTFALAIKEMPFLLLLTVSVYLQPQRYREILKQTKLAQTLGYSAFSSFILVGWPQLYPLLRLPIFAVLVYSGSSIEIPLLLGPSSPSTLAVTMLTAFNDVDLNKRFYASAFAINQVLVSFFSIGFWVCLERFGRWTLVALSKPHRARIMLSPLSYLATSAGVVSFVLVLLAFIGMLLLSFSGHWPFSSNLPTSYTLQHWEFALVSMVEPLKMTLLIGTIVSVVSLILCVAVLETLGSSRRLFLTLTIVNYIPLLVPMIVFMFGAAFLINQVWGNETLIAVFFLHFTVVTPYMWIALSRQYIDFDNRLITVAKTLGANGLRIFLTIKLPLMWSTLMVALALGMSISFSQYLPTLLGSGGALSTVTTEAVALASGGARRVTAVYGIVQVILPALAFVVLTSRLFKWNKLSA